MERGFHVARTEQVHLPSWLKSLGVEAVVAIDGSKMLEMLVAPSIGPIHANL